MSKSWEDLSSFTLSSYSTGSFKRPMQALGWGLFATVLLSSKDANNVNKGKTHQPNVMFITLPVCNPLTLSIRVI